MGRIAQWSITFCYLISFFLDSVFSRNIFLGSWGSNFWHEWHSNSFKRVMQNCFEFSVSQKNNKQVPKPTEMVMTQHWVSVSVRTGPHTVFSPFSCSETCYAWALNSLHHLSHSFPHYHGMIPAKASPCVLRQKNLEEGCCHQQRQLPRLILIS